MKKNEGPMLDWHRSDIEQSLAFRGGKYTDVNTWFALFVAALLTGLFFVALCHVPAEIRNKRVFDMVLDRGWTPYAMVGFFFLAMTIVFAKWRKLAFQRKALQVELVPLGDSFALTSETAVDVLKKLRETVDDPKCFVLFNRIERALQNLRNVGNLSDVSEMLRAQAENDENHMDSSYGLLAGIVWAIPILGFIGTVIGLSGAIGGFGKVLNSDASVSSLKEGLAPVTENLGVAFDTTFVALVLAMFIQLVVTLLRKSEELFMDECRDYAHVSVISRLRFKSGEGAAG